MERKLIAIPVSEELQKGAVKAVEYEIQMLIFSAAKLLNLEQIKKSNFSDFNQLEFNAYLESFGLHARCLYFFLYDDRRPNTRNHNDVFASDFNDKNEFLIEVRKNIAELENLREKANQQLAHICYERIEFEKNGKKGWDVCKYSRTLLDAIEIFLKNLEGEKKLWFVRYPIDKILRDISEFNKTITPTPTNV